MNNKMRTETKEALDYWYKNQKMSMYKISQLFDVHETTLLRQIYKDGKLTKMYKSRTRTV